MVSTREPIPHFRRARDVSDAESQLWVKSAVRKCGAHFRFASVSGGKADIPKSTRWADCVEEVGRRGRSNFSASWKRFPNQNVEGRMAEHRQSNYEANKSRF